MVSSPVCGGCSAAAVVGVVAEGWGVVGAVAAVVLSVKVTFSMQSEEQQVRKCWYVDVGFVKTGGRLPLRAFFPPFYLDLCP